MPRKYKRISKRGSWNPEDLAIAIEAVKSGILTVYRASKDFAIPRQTLERRIKNNAENIRGLGPKGTFTATMEKGLVSYLKKMELAGLPLTTTDTRRLAYEFAESKGIKHKFNKTRKMAGWDWLYSFLKRNKDLSVRKPEGLSIARAKGLNRAEVQGYFRKLEMVFDEYDLYNKPGSVFNVDESGLQMNNRPTKVIATKGNKQLSSLTSAEKGETITVVACVSAIGNFLPPCAVMKGKRKKPELEDGFPPGSILYMSDSGYINTALFLKWFKNHFLKYKPPGTVLLLLDGHGSHAKSLELFDCADSNDVVLFCLPSHTTHYLQPLDRSFFKALKAYFYQAANIWVRNHPGRKLTRYQFGTLLQEGWKKAATVGNGVNGFRACGVFPFSLDAIPEHAFAPSDGLFPHVSESSAQGSDHNEDTISPHANDPNLQNSNSHSEISDDFLDSRLPCAVPNPSSNARVTRKQTSVILNSQEHRQSLLKPVRMKKASTKNQANSLTGVTPKKRSRPSSSTISGPQPTTSSGQTSSSDNCGFCKNNYYDKLVRPNEEWIQCSKCFIWYHETCGVFVLTKTDAFCYMCQ